MKLKTVIALITSHIAVGAFGVGLGIYLLPILIAPDAPKESEVNQIASQAQFTATFEKERQDSDAFHWGEGEVSLTPEFISLMGELAPGPDYKLYLSPEFVETEADFNRVKPQMVRVGDVKTFENFVVNVPQGIEIDKYSSVIVWCETFGEFITSAKYQ